MIRPLTDHEYRIKESNWIDCTSINTEDNGFGLYTIIDETLNNNIAIGQLAVRVKAIGINPPSTSLLNAEALVSSVLDSDAAAYLTTANIVAGQTYWVSDKAISSENIITAVNELFMSLKAASLYSKIKYLYLFLGNGDAPLINAITPGTKNLTTDGSNIPSFSRLGATFDNQSYLESGILLSEFEPFDVSAGVYVSKKGGGYDFGVYDGENGFACESGSHFFLKSNILTGIFDDHTGFNILNIKSNSQANYINKRDIIFTASPSNVNFGTQNIWFGGLNAGAAGNFRSTKTLGAGYVGSSFTNEQIVQLNDLFDKWALQLRRGVTNRFYFFGDSITSGEQASNTNLRWTTLLTDELFGTENNIGIAGSTIVDLNLVKTSIKPKNQYDRYIFISFGTNESINNIGVETYKTNFRSLINFILNNGWSADDICLGLGYYNGATVNSTIQDTYIAAGQEIATEFSIERALNLKPIMIANGGDILVNGIHPIDAGYRIITNAWLEFLNGFE